MKKPFKILVIGAGGIASYALPLLNRIFDVRGTLYDGDDLEERNLERQDFLEKTIGKNKAEALIQSHRLGLTPRPHFFSRQHRSEARNYECLFCFADNRTAKLRTLEASDMNNIPCIIAGNEFIDNEAWFYHPDWKDGPADPRVRYSTLESSEPDLNDPVSCSDEAAQRIYPQLAMANAGAAHKAVHLAFIYFCHDLTDNLPYDMYTGAQTSTNLLFNKEEFSLES